MAKIGVPGGTPNERESAAVSVAGSALPRHVAIIMDGNGRWAKAHGLPRFEGHRRGVEAVRRTVSAARELGIEAVTIYSFSSENWSRPLAEVSELMGLLKRFIRSDLRDLHANNVRVRIIGEGHPGDSEIETMLRETEVITRGNTGLRLTVAFNYGSRNEIARAVQGLARDVAQGRLTPDDITPERIAERLDTADLPPLDLVIRTSGEQRLSNFLLWQAAYAELVFLPVHWPDFDRSWFEKALSEYSRRERRFGGIEPDGC
ncbi:undecaprenyl diphosphate synthase [Angulomicrobium tetraedrale]|uniref:Isoprenyl transferase n=1 Tax=Ancylobacter tetraedralis TaxID=217068 RepID=A0A839Z9B0_9HYPH|nr:isoprenyl transferase [Ancylobacter tetraedralis]MBB3770467.1 undecaprenyl diphosphate synthase [Ancylobacter tetraedralis]